MNLPDDFWKQAADCERAARAARDPDSRASWNRMAERWRRCAATCANQSATARNAAKRAHTRPAVLQSSARA
jgi:hypothetical protein